MNNSRWADGRGRGVGGEGEEEGYGEGLGEGWMRATKIDKERGGRDQLGGL